MIKAKLKNNVKKAILVAFVIKSRIFQCNVNKIKKEQIKTQLKIFSSFELKAKKIAINLLSK